MSRAAVAAAIATGAFGVLAVLLGGWFLLAAGANPTTPCAGQPLDPHRVPSDLIPIFAQAAEQYGLGPEGAAVLAGLTSIESDFGRNQGPSTAGAIGWTQFLPATWQLYGVDGDGDGLRDPSDPHDAIPAAANYLRHLGAPADWRRALLGYNHSATYVTDVLRRADELAVGGSATCESAIATGSVAQVTGGGGIVAIPGSPGQRIDQRILPGVLALQRQYRFAITAAYAASGHAPDGEHPLGLAIDVIPGPDGSWDDIDALAHLAEPEQNRPAAPFRWVGYDGDPGHGRGNHLHLSWQHGPPAPGHRPPASWVNTLAVP